jgi:hypothetical protein
MSTLALELDRLLMQLDRPSALALEHDVRAALARAKQQAETGTATDKLGYPIGYFEATAGSFANEALDVAPELPLQARETW